MSLEFNLDVDEHVTFESDPYDEDLDVYEGGKYTSLLPPDEDFNAPRSQEALHIIPENHYHISSAVEADRSPEQEQLIGEVGDFADRVSLRFGDSMLTWLENAKKHVQSGVNGAIIDHITEHALYMPIFKLFDSGNIPEELQAEFPNLALAEDELLMLFDLPKPLSQYWFKGGSSGKKMENDAVEVGASIPKWGSVYRRCHPLFWEEVGHEVSEGTLRFERVNEVRKHKSRNYYYLFSVRREELSHEEESTNMGAAFQAALKNS